MLLRFIAISVLCYCANATATDETKDKFVIFGPPLDLQSDGGAFIQETYGMYERRAEQTYIQVIPPLPEPMYKIVEAEDGSWRILRESENNLDLADFRILNKDDQASTINGNFFLEIRLNITFTTARSIEIKHLSDMNFALFGGASYTVVMLPESIPLADQLCQALDGHVASPETPDAFNFISSLLPSTEQYFWTGFYRNSSLDQWSWKINDGKGINLQLKEDYLNITQSGCVAMSSRGRLTVLDCHEGRNPFVCQTRQYFFHKFTWTKFYNERRDRVSAASICQNERHGGHLLTRHYRNLKKIISTFGYKDTYWIGYRRDVESGKYLSEDGLEISDEWEVGQPGGEDCVALNANRRHITVGCDTNVRGFICEYAPESGVQEVSFIDKGRIWISKQKYNYSEATHLCRHNYHRLLTIDTETLFYLLIEKMYVDKVYANTWIKLGPTVSVRNGFLVFNQFNTEVTECVTIAWDYIPMFKISDCSKKAFVMCQQIATALYIAINHVPPQVSYCPDEYVQVGESACYYYVEAVSTWPTAHMTCGRKGKLVDIYDVEFSTNQSRHLLIYLFLKERYALKIWSGMCVHAPGQLRFASDEQNIKNVNISGGVIGECAAFFLNMTTATETKLTLKYWKHKLPFLCQALTTTEKILPAENHILEYFNQVTFFLNPSFCPEGYIAHPLNSTCFGINDHSTLWNAGCRESNLLAYDQPETHNVSSLAMKQFEWISFDRAWIRIPEKPRVQFWFDDENHHGSNKGLCPSMTSKGYWANEDCDNHLPSWCEVSDCYKTSSITYEGKISTTRSGFLCQMWNDPSLQDESHPMEAHNYCRAFNGYFAPFCFTEDSKMRFESCDIPECDETNYVIENIKGLVLRDSGWTSRNFVQSCEEDEVLLDCYCSNEHCQGVEIYSDQSCLLHALHRNSYVSTKVTTLCYNIKKKLHSKIILETGYDVASVECHLALPLVGCFISDVTSNKTRSDFGKGKRDTSTCFSDQSRESKLTTICSISHNVDQAQPHHSVDLRTNVAEMKHHSYFSLSRTEFKTLCLWVQPKTIGSFLYAAVDPLRPYLFVYAQSVDEGIFIAPDDSKHIFNISRLYDGYWHHMCVVSDVPHDVGSVCQLYIDGEIVALTTGTNACSLAHYSGHVVIGSLAKFLPLITYRNGRKAHPRAILNGTETNIAFYNFGGFVGGIYGSESSLSSENITSFLWQCNLKNNLFNDRSFYYSSWFIYHDDKNPCLEHTEKYGISTKLSLQQVEESLIFQVRFHPNSLKYMEDVNVVSLALHTYYHHHQTDNDNGDVGEKVFQDPVIYSLTEEEFLFEKTLYSVEYASYYSFRVSITTNNQLLNQYELGKSAASISTYTTPHHVINLRSNPSGKLNPGTDVISWNPPSIGESYDYTVIVYAIENAIEKELVEEVLGVEHDIKYNIGTDQTDDLLPGQRYTIAVTATYHGKESRPLYYSDNTQPGNVVLTKISPLPAQGFREAIMTVFWSHNNSKFIDFYIVAARAIGSDNSISYTVGSDKTSFQITNLRVDTKHSFMVIAHAGTKEAQSNAWIAATNSYVPGAIYIDRLDRITIAVRWKIALDCVQYNVIATIIGPINGSAETARCTTMDISHPIATYCNDYVRKYQRYFNVNISLPITGCKYLLSVRHFDVINGPNMTYQSSTEYSNPLPLSQVQGMRLISSSMNHVEIAWNASHPDELVDRYMVSLTQHGISAPVYSTVVASILQLSISDLQPGRNYLFTITSLHHGQSGDSNSLEVRTRNNNDSEITTMNSRSSCLQCSETCDVKSDLIDICIPPYSAKVNKHPGRKKNIERVVYDIGSSPLPHDDWSTMSFDQQMEALDCIERNCKVNGTWSAWSNFHSCSRTCGEGVLLLTRTCQSNLSAWYKLASCEGNSTMLQTCYNEPCPVDGEWSEWTRWTSCIIICGIHNSTRVRTCNSPAPSNGGKLCDGYKKEETQVRQCVGPEPCKGDYIWGQWSHFTDCSLTCGINAIRVRNRRCEWREKIYSASHLCPDVETETYQCGPDQCPIHGNWGLWTNWSPCSVSCDRGVQYRHRICDNPPPTSLGDECIGDQYEGRACIAPKCPSRRYRSSTGNIRYCRAEVSALTGLHWDQEYAGLTQNTSCPVGTVGKAYRKCSQNQIWFQEDLDDCVIPQIHEILSFIETTSRSEAAFEETSQSLLSLLQNQKDYLKTSGDLIAVKRITKTLMSWEPSLFPEFSRSDRLDSVNFFTSALESAFRPKLRDLWHQMNTTALHKTFKSLLSSLDDVALHASLSLDSREYGNYQTSTSPDLNLILIAKSGWNEEMKYPEDDSVGNSYDKTFVRIPKHVVQASDNSSVRISLMKYNDNYGLMTSLPMTSLSNNQHSFGGRTLNSAMIGVQIMVDEVKKHHLDSHIYITFYHKRESEDPICVYVDIVSDVGMFNDDGCGVWRRGEDYTVCRCNHLTTFALLSHDVITDSLRRKIAFTDFRSLMAKIGYFCIAVLLLLLLLVFRAQVIKSDAIFLSLNVIFATLLRHLVVEVLFNFTFPDGWACTSVAACLNYTCAVCCSWQLIRFLYVIGRMKNANQQSLKEKYGLLAWILTLLAGMPVLILFGLYDYETNQHTISCDVIFDTYVMMPSWGICGYVTMCSVILIIYAGLEFKKIRNQLKPVDAFRVEKLLWLYGFHFLISSISVSSTYLVLIGLRLPSIELQFIYAIAVMLEAIYTVINELWMPKDVRAFYYRMLRIKPPVEKVVYKPPKYIP